MILKKSGCASKIKLWETICILNAILEKKGDFKRLLQVYKAY